MAYSLLTDSACCIEQQTPETLWAVCSRRLIESVSSQVQPPDTENRMSGGVGGIANAILLSRPDRIKLQSTGLTHYSTTINR